MLFLTFLSVSLCLFFPMQAYAYYTNMNASLVIGEPDFRSAVTGATANTIGYPYQMDTDGTKFIVADSLYHRALVYNHIPTSNNQAADVVIGQANFTGGDANQNGSAGGNTLNLPDGVAVINEKLLIADFSNNRVLIFNTIPTRNNTSADLVIGQSSLSGSGSGTSQTTLSGTSGVAYDPSTGKVVIADYSNNRVLIYNHLPAANGASADVVIGHSDFNTATGGTSAVLLTHPYSARILDNKLMVADFNNNRVLIWNSVPTTNGVSADVVIGQVDFTHGSANQGGSVNANTLSRPADMNWDGRRLYVSDTGNSRVLIYNGIPTRNNASADVVLGQANFTSSSVNQGGSVNANTIAASDAFILLINDQLFIGDNNNTRILIYKDITSTPQLNINIPPSPISGNNLKITGDVLLGNRGTYALQWVKADINGQGAGNVTTLGGGRDDGSDKTRYDFSEEFNSRVNGGDTSNFTAKFIASSFNADSTSLFYFLPFNFDYIRRNIPLTTNKLNISFTVNKSQAQRVKDNIDHFEIQTSTDSGKMWKKLATNISSDMIDTVIGQVYITITNTLLPGVKYLVKVDSISKNSNWRQSSNSLTYFVPKKKVVSH